MPTLRRRILAIAIDSFLALTLSALSAGILGRWCAERAVLALAIDDPSSWWRGPLPLVLGILGNVVYSLPLTVLAVGASRLAFGRTPGESLCRIDPGPGHRWLGWIDDHAPAILLSAALLLGRLPITEVLLGLLALWLLRRIGRAVTVRSSAQRV